MARNRADGNGDNALDAADIQQLSLDELTRRTGVTTRTVRYYTSEGLLPPPVTSGRGNHYTRAHLDRLLLIGVLKDSYLPLKEIRRHLASMTDQEIFVEVESMLGDAHDLVAMSTPLILEESEVPRSSASRYIQDVIDRSNDVRVRRGLKTSVPLSRTTDEPIQWRRITISDDAELMISEDAYLRRKEQLDTIITWVKRALDGS